MGQMEMDPIQLNRIHRRSHDEDIIDLRELVLVLQSDHQYRQHSRRVKTNPETKSLQHHQ